MRLILTFLTEKQVIEVNNRIFDEEGTYSILASFKELTRQQKAILGQHIRDLKYPNSSGILGSKRESYYEEDEIGVLPTYSWDELSKNEKDLLKPKEDGTKAD